MRDETTESREITLEQEDSPPGSVAIDPDGRSQEPRVGPPVGAALSVLWWLEEEPPTG